MLDLGFDIGINGCSMKTEDNVDVVRAVPLGRLHLETDGPWCEMRPSHASKCFLEDMKPVGPIDDDGAVHPWKSVKKERWEEGRMIKGRNEPCMIPSVAWAIAKIKGVEVDIVTDAAWRNGVRMFGLGEKVSIAV